MLLSHLLIKLKKNNLITVTFLLPFFILISWGIFPLRSQAVSFDGYLPYHFSQELSGGIDLGVVSETNTIFFQDFAWVYEWGSQGNNTTGYDTAYLCTGTNDLRIPISKSTAYASLSYDSLAFVFKPYLVFSFNSLADTSKCYYEVIDYVVSYSSVTGTGTGTILVSPYDYYNDGNISVYFDSNDIVVSVFADIRLTYQCISKDIDNPYPSNSSFTYSYSAHCQGSAYGARYADSAMVAQTNILHTDLRDLLLYSSEILNSSHAINSSVQGLDEHMVDRLEILDLDFHDLRRQLDADLSHIRDDMNTNTSDIRNDLRLRFENLKVHITDENTRLINAILNPSEYPPDDDAGSSQMTQAVGNLDSVEKSITDVAFTDAGTYDISNVFDFSHIARGVIIANMIISSLLNSIGMFAIPLSVGLALIFVAILVGIMRYRS